jgi:hypothetical protein
MTSSDGSAEAARWLGGVRALIFALWLIKLSSGALEALAWLPISLLQPPLLLDAAPLSVWEWVLRPAVLNGVQFSAMLLAALAAAGVRPYRPIAVGAAALVTFDQGLVRSFGYSNHPEMFLVLATWIIAVAPAADGFRWPRSTVSRPAPIYVGAIAFIALVGCWTYSAPAAYRLAHHGLEVFTSDSMKYAVVMNSFRFGDGVTGAYLLERPALAGAIQLLLPVTTAMELAAPLTLLSRRFLWFWLPFLLVFHVITAAAMTILFWESMLALSAALIAFDRLWRREV